MADDKVEWHRLVGLLLRLVFLRLRYETQVEVDLSLKQQFVDIIVVRKKELPEPDEPLPPIYWQDFGELNEYNLISFKSYSESFNALALEEFYGHLTNFCKINNVPRTQVNLYAIVHHFPRDLLGPFQQTGQVTANQHGAVYDLRLGSLQPVRFILCQETDNPVLALFSGNEEKVYQSYAMLQENTDLLEQLSSYFQRIMEYYGEEFVNMYTEKDFRQDHPPTNKDFLFPWEEEYQKRLQEVSQESWQDGHDEGREEGREEERKATARTMRDLGLEWALITTITGLTEEQIRTL